MVVRGGWAPPPMEGKGPREGQRMAIGQWAPLAADENNTPWGYAKPPPSSTPLLQQHAPPPPNAPQGRKKGGGGEETGKGEKDEPRRVTRRGRSRSPKMVRTAEGEQGKEKRERMIVVVRSHCQENCRADAHPSALKSVLESANPAWTRRVHLDAPGQRHGQQPVSGTANPGVVKQDKSSRGSVDTTKTKTRSGPQRVRMSSGERPIGAAKGKQSDTEALCHPPPPPPPGGTSVPPHPTSIPDQQPIFVQLLLLLLLPPTFLWHKSSGPGGSCCWTSSSGLSCINFMPLVAAMDASVAAVELCGAPLTKCPHCPQHQPSSTGRSRGRQRTTRGAFTQLAPQILHHSLSFSLENMCWALTGAAGECAVL